MTLKNRSRLGSAIDTRLFDSIKTLSKETRIPISKLLDEAVADLLIKHKDKFKS